MPIESTQLSLTVAASQKLSQNPTAPTLDLLVDLGPLPESITVYLDAGYDSDKTRAELAARSLHGRIAHRGEKVPIQASRRWHVERTHASQNAFYRLARCYERRVAVIDAFFDLADTIITVRSLLRRTWTTQRWETVRTAAHERVPIYAASECRSLGILMPT